MIASLKLRASVLVIGQANAGFLGEPHMCAHVPPTRFQSARTLRVPKSSRYLHGVRELGGPTAPEHGKAVDRILALGG